MPAASKYKYDQRMIYCKCRQCLPGSDGVGRRQPLYTFRRHAALNLAAQSTEPRVLNPDYIAQPFSRPQQQQQQSQQPQQQTAVRSTAVIEPAVDEPPAAVDSEESWSEEDARFEAGMDDDWDVGMDLDEPVQGK
ncbi:hypothetical protein ACEPAF_7692 [Sanghuangporus sanghuang]